MLALSVNSQPKESQEFFAFKNSLQFQDWFYRVQSIIQATGLPANSDFSKQDMLLPSNSFSSRFGHKTLGEFILNSASSYGLEMGWPDWINQYTAFEFKNRFSIFENDISEVIAQVKDVELALGRMPINSAEYHKAKDDILINHRREAELRHLSESRLLNDKIFTLESTVSELNLKINSMELQQSTMINQEELSVHLGRLSEKENEILSLYEQIKKMENNVEYASSCDIEKLEKNLSQAMSFVHRFREQNSALKADNGILRSKIKRLEGRVRSQNESIKSLKNINKSIFEFQMKISSAVIVSASILVLIAVLIIK